MSRSRPPISLPDWLVALPDASQQRALDNWAIDDRGIPSLRLMERAGAGLAARTAELAPEGPIAVVCGSGNNGGDGLVAARLLRERGHEVRVLLLAEPDRLSPDSQANLELLQGPAPEPFSADRLDGATAVIDAILGTGFQGSPREPAASAIAAINARRSREPRGQQAVGGAGTIVVACDVPSGVDASTGAADGAAVRAEATVTFHAAKPGLWIAPGKDLAGELSVIDIGIPDGSPIAADVGLITDAVLAGIPRRHPGSTKFTAGSVLVCGGSRGLTGAVVMASKAATRAGAGYVTVAVPDALVQVMQIKLLEVMSIGLPESDGDLIPDALDVALERVERASALVLGPGLGRNPGAQEFARGLAARAAVPLLLDADGLNAHAREGGLEELAARVTPTILTPHAGELGRLLGLPSDEIEAHRLYHARDAAARADAVVVLKGDDTIIAEPGRRVAVSPGGASMLATAGTGDVLSGAIGALLAKGMEPFEAACAGVLAHVRAGQLAAARVGSNDGVLAGDVIEVLPAAFGSGGAG